MDLSMGQWITHLRISPAIAVMPTTSLHMKHADADISPKDALWAVSNRLEEGTTTPNGDSLKRRIKGDASELIDLTDGIDGTPTKKPKIEPIGNQPTSPFISKPTNDNVEFIGIRPARLSKFPARTVHEMVSRIEWIVNSETPRSTAARYNQVFSSEFKGSTYYKHQGIWKWLKDHNKLASTPGNDLWKEVAARTTDLMEKEKSDGKTL